MPRFIKNISEKKGLPPGTLIHIGDESEVKTKISVIDYTKDNFEITEVFKVEDLAFFKGSKNPSWIDIIGINNDKIIEEFGKLFEFHPLVLEDIMNSGQRPKFEDYDNYLYIVLKMLTFDDLEKKIKSEQVSMIITKNCVLTFQERKGDVFEPIRQRIRSGKGRIRKMSTDYLGYSLIDTIVDNYFTILEKFAEDIEGIEEELISDPEFTTLQLIHQMKRELLFLRKAAWPLRDLISSLYRSESALINKNSEAYFRDLHDHAIQVIDTIEIFRDMISGMLDVYLSCISNKMNEIMKVLTIFAAIFIPLTFIAGVYGMNFEYMPELKWHWGYFGVLGIMAVVAITMIAYFKRKKWL